MFALNWYIFVALANEELLLPLQCMLKYYFLFDLEKLIENWNSAINIVSPNPYDGTLPRIEICFPLLSICHDELISTPKVMTFLSMLAPGAESSEREKNPMPWPLYKYLSRSALLANLTLSNVQSFKVKSEFKSRDYVSNT